MKPGSITYLKGNEVRLDPLPGSTFDCLREAIDGLLDLTERAKEFSEPETVAALNWAIRAHCELVVGLAQDYTRPRIVVKS